MKRILTILILGMSLSSFAFFGQKNLYKNIDVDEFIEIIKDDEVVILDLRTASEVNRGYVEGAVNIDYYANDFVDSLEALDKEKKYVIYCRSGNRSGRALEIMKKLEFKEVYNLKGGITALLRKNYSLVM